MNKRKLLLLALVAGLGLANAHATLLVRELFDNIVTADAPLNGQVDTATSVGFEPSTTWVGNAAGTYANSLMVANNFNVNPAVTNAMPFQLGTGNANRGGIWWGASGHWDISSWVARQLAAGSQLNMGVDAVYYAAFNLTYQSDDSVGFAFATGSTDTSAFISVGPNWNNTSFNGNASAKRLAIAKGDVLSTWPGVSGASAYSAAQFVNNTRYVVLVKITASASGNDTVQAAFFAPSRSGYGILPAAETSVAWDVTYTFTDGNIYTHLLAFMNGGSGGLELDAFRLGTTYADVVQITPIITAQPTPAPSNTIYAGVTVSMNAAVTGGLPDPYAFQWWKGNSPVANATNASLVLSNTIVEDSGDYYLAVTNSYGFTFSLTNTITFLPSNPPILTLDAAPLAPTRFVNGYVTFAAGIDGTPPFTYQWKHEGTNLPAGTNATLALTGLTLADAGTYTLFVTNKFGWTNTATATLAMLTPATGSYEEMIVTNKPIAYFRVNEGAYAYDVPAAAYEYMGGNDAYHTNVFTLDGIRPPAYLGMETTNNAAYYNGTAASSTTASLMNNLSQFTLMGWFNPVIWPQVTGTGSGRVALFGQNDAGEFGFHGTNIVGMWTPGGGFVSFNASTLISAGNWYFITAVGNGTNVTFYLNGNQAAQFSQTTTNYGSSGYPFRIGYGVLDAGANEFNGMIDEVALFNRALSVDQVNALYAKALGVAQPPSVIVQPVGATRYVTQTASFSVTAAGTLPLHYQWRHGSTEIPGATSNSLVLANLTTADAGNYDVVITNRAGITNSTLVALNVLTPRAGSYEEAIVGLKPMAYYRLNEAVGSSTAVDAWGGFDATVGVAATLGGAGPANPPFPGFEAANTRLTTANGVANSYATTPAFNLNTNTGTLSAWVYADGGQGGYRGIVFSRAGNTTAGIHTGDGNELRYSWNDADTTWGWNSGLEIPTGEWCLVAAVIEPTRAILYVGTPTTLKSATNNVAHAIEEFDGATTIGRDPNNDARIWNGGIDEVMIVNRTLSFSEISALWQKATGVKFQLTLTPGGLIEDTKPAGTLHHGQNSGVAWVASLADSGPTPPPVPVTRTGVGQFSAVTGSQVSTPVSADFSSAYGTICFWMLATNVPLPTPGNEGAMLFDHRTTNGAVLVLHDDGSIFWQGQPDAQNSFAAGYVADGNWHHVAVTYGQTVGDTIALYVDGALANSVSVTNGWSWPTTQPIELGRSWDGWWKRFDGFMDDVRVYNRVLTADEIGSINTSDALVDPAALKVRYNFGTVAGVGQTVAWPFGTLLSSPALGPSAVWTPVNGATPPKFAFPTSESSLFFRAAY